MIKRDNLADSEWITLSRAVAALIDAGLLPPFDQDPIDGCLYMAPGAEQALTEMFCREAFAGRLRLKGYPTGYGDELPAGPLQEIPAEYFHRERMFYGANAISQMPGDWTAADVRRQGALIKAGCPESDWVDVLVSGPLVALLIETLSSTTSGTKASKAIRPGPDLERVVDTLRVARVWKAEQAAAGKLPRTANARALACHKDRKSDLKHGVDALRKMFEGKYAAAVRAVEEGRAVAIWET